MGEPKPRQDHINVPYTPHARFALMQLDMTPGIRQVHLLPISKEARQKAAEQTLALCAEAMRHDGKNVIYHAANLLNAGIIPDHAFVFVYGLARKPLAIPPEHEVFSIYNQHVGEIIESMERTAGATKIVFSREH